MVDLLICGAGHIVIAKAEKKAASGEVRCVAGTAPALLQSGVRRHFIRRIISPYISANHSFRVFFS